MPLFIVILEIYGFSCSNEILNSAFLALHVMQGMYKVITFLKDQYQRNFFPLCPAVNCHKGQVSLKDRLV